MFRVENLTSRGEQESVRSIRIRKFVRREHEACHGAAHRNIVTGVRDKIHVEIAANCVD